MSDIRQLNLGAQHILYDASRQPEIQPDWFVPDYWRRRNCVTGSAQGRAGALFFLCQDREYVLRHYHRGGMVSRLLFDQYMWTGLDGTRAWREWRLLDRLNEMKLPVPVPVAARVQRNGLYYRADLITERIAGAGTLTSALTEGSLPDTIWRRIGEVIRCFHNVGVCHADLNAHNILLNEQQVYLLDFDRGRLRGGSTGWRQGNLRRLLRSLTKLKTERGAFYFEPDDWQTLLRGYGS